MAASRLRMGLMITMTAVNIASVSVTVYLVWSRNAPSLFRADRTTAIEISLSALNVMVACLAIVVALSAIWGFTAVREAAERKAGEVAAQVAAERTQFMEQEERIAAAVVRQMTREATRDAGGESPSRRPVPRAPKRPSR